MDMILLDWTRMGRFYCLAGAVSEGGGWKIVRPLLSKHRGGPVRNIGWPPFSLTNHSRWEIFQLIRPQAATAELPHLEDTWIDGMQSRRKSAPVEQRRAILEATVRADGEPLFGTRLTGTKTAAYLKPGTGARSLATMIVDAAQVWFSATRHDGSTIPDVRVMLNVPGLQGRSLPVKDHWLLLHAEQAGANLTAYVNALTAHVNQMGDQIAVRLGLSRGFDPENQDAHNQGNCWLMADGFFSLHEPQP